MLFFNGLKQKNVEKLKKNETKFYQKRNETTQIKNQRPRNETKQDGKNNVFQTLKKNLLNAKKN
jgi:hypothetical protein